MIRSLRCSYTRRASNGSGMLLQPCRSNESVIARAVSRIVDYDRHRGILLPRADVCQLAGCASGT